LTQLLSLYLLKLKFRLETGWHCAVQATTFHQTKQEIASEYELIKKCKKNPEYFGPIYRKYHEQLFLFIFKRVDHLEVTADLTSRVFLKALKNIQKYKHQGVPFSAWLYKIAINEINSFFRQQQKMVRTVNMEDQHVDLLIDEIEYHERIVDPHILIPVLLEQLDESEIQLIELRFFENRSFKEIGYLLGLTEVNAKIKTYRILKKLKKIVAEVKYNE
ncbi:MAG: sigma-70 family RNA polymerase sigma factor, partial [Fulvivirga sp.]|nr:sigma-70 family RNA polymerase sigma factor [Fulvivirga sp.]